MTTIIILIIICVVITVLIVAGFGEGVFTCRCDGSGGPKKGHLNTSYPKCGEDTERKSKRV